jgi:phage tail sheath protein FI
MDQICSVRQDCVAILDLPSNMQETADAINYRRDILNLNSSLSALYGPDLKIRDSVNGVDVWVPPSGHIAGVFSRTDAQAATWFAPAGTERGQLSGILDLRHNYKQGHRNALVENQINIIRSISGQGTVVWGADTLYAVKSALNDIGIRRMLAMLHSTIQIQNLYAVFRPNDSLLRDRQKATIDNLLEPIKRGRGLYWYEVICSEKNNPPDVIANGDLIIDVYLDPTRYTKRIHLNAVVAKTGGLQASVELVDQTS